MTVIGEFNTNKDVKVETSVENQIADGSKVTLTGEQKGKETYATLAGEYKHNKATLTTSVDFGKSKGNTIKGTGVFGQSGFLLGLSAEYLLSSDHQELKLFNTTVGYSTKDYDLNVFGRIVGGEKGGDRNEIGGSYYHNVKEEVGFGLDVVHNTTSGDNPKLTFGGRLKVNEETTMKGKFDTAGQLSFSVNQKMTKNTSFILAARVDTGTISGKPASSLGFSFGCNF